jgi:acetyl esterase/lipase
VPSAEHEQVVALMRAAAAGEAATETWEEARARLDGLGALFAVPGDVEVEPADVAGVPCERFRPAAPTLPPGALVVYAHGGSYTAGSLASHRALTARLARACGCEAVAVGYRLAPEHPHPAGLEDAAAVYRRLLAGGADPGRVLLAGDSAGGGLVTALLLALRDDGDPLPAGAVLLSPWLDLTLSGEAVTARAADDPMLRAEALARSARAYAGEDLGRPLVSPVFADPAGLPPLLVLVGTAEILLDDSRTFAARAAAAGVEVDLDVEDGLIHVWPFVDGIPEAAAAMDRIGGWARRRLAGAGG